MTMHRADPQGKITRSVWLPLTPDPLLAGWRIREPSGQ